MTTSKAVKPKGAMLAIAAAALLVVAGPAMAAHAYTSSQYANNVERTHGQRITSVQGTIEGGQVYGSGTAALKHIASFRFGHTEIWHQTGYAGFISGTHAPTASTSSKCWWTYNPPISGSIALSCWRFIT